MLSYKLILSIIHSINFTHLNISLFSHFYRGNSNIFMSFSSIFFPNVFLIVVILRTKIEGQILTILS
jgi:hypothetical protein